MSGELMTSAYLDSRTYQLVYNRHRAFLACHREWLLRHRDVLIAETRAAFADVDREGGVSISEALAIGDRATPEQRAAARAGDRDRHWTDIDVPTQDPGGAALSFMDDIGLRYHLPAYITCWLWWRFASHDECPNLNAIDGLMYHLHPLERLVEWTMSSVYHLIDGDPAFARRWRTKPIRDVVDRNVLREPGEDGMTQHRVRRLGLLNQAQRANVARVLAFATIVEEPGSDGNDPLHALFDCWEEHLAPTDRERVLAYWRWIARPTDWLNRD